MSEETGREKWRSIFTLPKQYVMELNSDLIKNPKVLLNEYEESLVKFVEWTSIYLLGVLGFSYAWIISLFLLYLSRSQFRHLALQDTILQEDVKKIKEDGFTFGDLPSWVAYPDVEKCEWINTIIRRVWPHCASLAQQIAKHLVEPKINKILDRLRLMELSNFKLKRFDLGTVAATIGGIKVYDRNTSTDEIIIDIQFVYQGDATVSFTLQNLGCQISEVSLKGTVRLVVKPLMDSFPIVGGFQLFFMDMPQYDYNLGKMANFGEIPGVSNIIKSVLDTIIRRMFVWPHRFSFYFPLESVKRIQDISYMMPLPEGVLEVELIRARHLMKKDKSLRGGKSDPYVVLSVGEKLISFKDRYIENTVDPEWNYFASFLLEDVDGINLNIQVYDYDSGFEDDFLGSTVIPIESVLASPLEDHWIRLDQAKHGEIQVNISWRPARYIEEDLDKTGGMSSVIVCAFIHSCSNLNTIQDKKSGHTRCEMSLTSAVASSGANKTPTGGSPLRSMSRKWSSSFLKQKTPLSPVETYVTKTKGPSDNPVFLDGHYFLSQNPDIDHLSIQVIDGRSGNTCGRVLVPVNAILDKPGKQFHQMEWDIETDDEYKNSRAKAVISCKLLTC